MGLLSRFRSSLTYPIAATLVLVTVVPVALVGFLLASYNQEHLTTVEKQYLTRQAVSLANEASMFVDSHRKELERSVRALNAAGTENLPSFETVLRSIGEEPGRSFVYLQILTVDGEGTFVRTPTLEGAPGREVEDLLRDVHRQVIEGSGTELRSVFLPRPHAAGIVMAFPLQFAGGEPWGSLQGVVDLTTLERRLQDTSYSGMLVSLINTTGDVLVSSRVNLRRQNLSDSPLVTDFIHNAVRLTLTYRHPVDRSVGMVLGSVAPIDPLGWGIVTERPTAEAFAPVKGMYQRTAMISAVAALVALAVGFGLSRRLTRPIQTLAGVSSEIADGNLAVRAEVYGKDETAQLAANFNHMAGSIEALVRRLKQALRQNQELFLETIRTLAAAIDAKDPYTRGHSERVSSYSMAIARHLGLNQDEVFRVRIAAILHDVGKLGIRDGILNKPAGLTDEEFAVMRRHPEIGAQIMAPIRMLKDIIPGIRNHHETWDGAGYPDRLKGEEIPQVARIIGVADTFDAMTTTRPYQKAMTLEYVVSKINAMAGTRFDSRVITAFMAAAEAGDLTPPSNDQHQAKPQQEAS